MGKVTGLAGLGLGTEVGPILCMIAAYFFIKIGVCSTTFEGL